jgi:hypothetical protein
MATEEIAFKITTDSSQTEKSVKSIKTELREATQEALNLSRKFGDSSKEAIQAQQKVANLKDEVGDFRDRVEALNPDAKFKAFSQTLQGVAGGFAGLQGAVGLFGTESAELEKQLLKVQSALALSEGLNSVLASKDAFRSLAVVIKTNVVSAFKTMRGALIATGIGAAVVAVGLLIANFDEVKKVVLNFIPGLAKVGEFIGKLVEKVTDFVGITSKAERAYDSLAKTNKNANEEIKRRIDLLSAQGGKEAEIAELSKRQAENELNTLRAKLADKGKLNEEELKQFKDLKNQKAVIDAEEAKRIKDEQTKSAEDAKKKREEDKKTAEEAEAKRLEKLGAIRVKEFEAKKADEAQKDLLAKNLIDKNKLAEDELLKRALNTKLFDSTTTEQTELRKQRAAYETNKIVEELDASRLRIKQEKAQGEIQLLFAVSNAAGQVADLLGKESQAGKAVAVAQALINTYLGITAGVKLGFPAAIPAVLAASVTGFKAVKSIMAVNIPGGGGGGSMPSGASSPASFATAMTAPIQSGVNVQQTALTPNGNGVNLQNQTVIKAYVVESDITDSQDRINKIKAAATI